jgi:ornithine carbamoyltransferase
VKKDLVSFHPLAPGEIEDILALAAAMKASPHSYRPMANKTAAMIFEKQSLRTHVSFEVGIAQLGGQAVYLNQQQIGLSSRESVEDVAEVLSRYNDLIIARTMRHDTIERLARAATVPVINALSDLLHPCQILADALTMRERGILSPATKIAFIGDGNNMVNSWLELAEKMPLHFVLGCPKGYEPDAAILARARAAGVSRIEIVHDPMEAARGAGVLYTDVWVSMGQEEEKLARQKAFQGFQIDMAMLRAAHPKCIVMHCLPAHRGEEITAEVMASAQSAIMDEAENRLHAQKALIAFLLLASGSATHHHESRLVPITA